MPAKGKRVAVRQAQLNRRRRRQVRAAEAGVQTAESEGGSPAASINSPTAATVPAAGSDAGARQEQPQPAAVAVRPVTTTSSQSRNTQPMAYTHLARELRRILILAGIITAVLIGVSFAI